MTEIEELFLEMKDTSELMLDLAYSAFLYNNKEIAAEVLELEEEIDALYNTIQQVSIAESIKSKEVNKSLALMRLASCIEVIGDSAMEIADVVLRDIEPHPVFRMSMRESDVIITRAVVGRKSVMAGKTLGEMRLASESGMWVIAVKRGKKWIYGPDENTRIEGRDVLLVRGPVDSEKWFIDLAKGIVKEM